MIGYTDAELDKYFGKHMAAHRAMMGLDAAAYRKELHRQFNGYRFWKRTGGKSAKLASTQAQRKRYA